MKQSTPQEQPVTATEMLNDSLLKIERFFDDAMQGRLGGYGAFIGEWPLRVYVNHPEYRPHWIDPELEINSYEYSYPIAYFRMLQHQYDLVFKFNTNQEKKQALSFMLDQLKAERLNIHLFHFGLYIIHASPRTLLDILKMVGKKREGFYYQQPRMRLVENDDYLISSWMDLKEYNHMVEGQRSYPNLTHTRIQFKAELFSQYNSMSFDADWIEPISFGRPDQVIQHQEKTTVAIVSKVVPEMDEGEIILGHEGADSGLRHFVNGKPIYAGQSIHVQFGDAWIKGRYEWSFDQDTPIRIYSERGDYITICEGHRVQIQK